ncbi:unnamed protein product [Sphagnum troendelagicum]|uniref:Uncharacterized protein n=1 Tax=Sphagnum troendelagicum TaxID=128251 RepID=A0ABP0UNI8_9BRYO
MAEDLEAARELARRLLHPQQANVLCVLCTRRWSPLGSSAPIEVLTSEGRSRRSELGDHRSGLGARVSGSRLSPYPRQWGSSYKCT